MLGDARDALARAEKAAGELAGRRDVLAESRSRIADDLAEAARRFTEAETQLAGAPDLGDLRDRLEALAATVTRDRGVLADARALHEGLKREAEARVRRLAAIATDRGTWVQRAANAETQIASLGERRVETASELESLADTPDEIDAKRRALLSQLSEAETLRKAAADRLQEAETKQAALDKAATAAITALSEAREGRARAEERLNAADERRREAEARIQEVLNTPPHLAIRQAELDADAPLPDMAEVEKRLDRLKVERERLGAVNLRAEEEQRELSERLETIVSEREDVIEAIKKLRQAIQSLNREGRERLLAAFDVVNGHFQRLFTHLFGGGTAELQLIESEDPLEAGLEILARPPGKKPQTMTLLVRRRAGADGHGADLRRVPDQSRADLRARRGRRAARRSQCRTFLQSDGRDGVFDRDALRHHHPQPDHHGAHEPAVRRDHGRAGRQPARIGQSRNCGTHARGKLNASARLASAGNQ